MSKQFEQFDLKPRPRSRNTINNVPVDILDGHLPPPERCPDCNYPTWFLNAPDSVVQDDKRSRPAIYQAEYEPEPEWRCEGQIGSCTIHPYHLRPHRGDRCRPGRIEPVFPAGLLVRPPRVGEING